MDKVTILAAMHGNETYGIELHRAFVAEYPELKEYVQLVIGNNLAYKKNVRFIDTDMNRSYGSTGNTHEKIEIARVERLLEDFKPNYIIDVHTTFRSSGIFFISGELNNSRKKLTRLLPIDTCVLKHEVVKSSFIGNHINAISLEYSLDSITKTTTQLFIKKLRDLILQTVTADSQSNLYEVNRLISYEEWKKYPGLANYETKTEGIALMVPKDESEMDAEYYGFWCSPYAAP